MQILVSFLNLLTPGRPSLGALDSATFDFRTLSLSHALPRCNGVTGLAASDRHIYVVVQSPPTIVVLDKTTFSPVAHYSFESALDVHSIRVEDDLLFAVSAGTDEVLELRLNGTDRISESVAWRPDPAGPRLDLHHLNSICRWRGDVLVSGFGKKTERGWSSAHDGFIHNITRGERVISGLRNPHSLTAVGDTLAYCESACRRLRLLGDDREVQLPGYSRGVCVAGSHLFVGTSARRRVSKSTGQANLETGPAAPPARCTISRLSVDDLRVEKTIDLSAHEMEIYDLLPLQEIGCSPMCSASEAMSAADPWWRQVESAMYDIAQSTSPQSTLLLACKGWTSSDTLMGRRCIRFPKPANGGHAVRELERLRLSPAHYLVFGWMSFWWLDYYPEFRQHVRHGFPCIIENDRVIVFDLRQGT